MLSVSRIRKHFIFLIKQKYYHDLEHSIPLSANHWAHILEDDAYDSFSEIFIQQEYNEMLPNISLLKILDLGANYGYFSLWLQSKYPNSKIFSLLIEPSPRCRRSLEKLVEQPIFEGRFKWIERAVGNPRYKDIDFFNRPYMSSSTIESSSDDLSEPVNILKIEELTDAMPPPYDLIKCDVEGSEWEFLNYYSPVIKKAKYLLLEWHSWHSGNGGFPQIEKKLTEIGFQIIKSSPAHKAVGRDGEVGLFLAQNLNFQN